MDDEKILKIADDQLNFLDRMSALHRQRMLDSIQALERRIVDRASALKTSESGNLLGAKTNLAQAQKVHSDMTALFDEEYGAASRETVKEYSESLPIIQQQYEDMGEAVKYTGVDRDMVKALKTQDLAAYASYGLAAQDKIAKAVYNHVIAQAPFSALVGEIAAALTGQKDKRGRPLANYAKQMANDGIMNFHNTVNLKKAEDAGFTNYLYVGNIIADSRPFCIARAGNVYTREQIDSWTGTWQGKSGPAFTHRGGYNCRHHWQPVRKEWIPEGGIEVQSWFDRAGVMPVSKLPKAVTGAPKFKAYQAWQQSVLIGKKPLDAAAVAKAAGVPKSAASGWLSQWQRGYNLPQGWQSVVRDLEAKAGGFERARDQVSLAASAAGKTVLNAERTARIAEKLSQLKTPWRTSEGVELTAIEAAELGKTNPLSGKHGVEFFTKTLGHSESTWKEVRDLLDAHGSTKGMQEKADAKIKELLLGNSRKSKLLRDISSTETSLLRAYYNGHVKRVELMIKEIEENLAQNKRLGIADEYMIEDMESEIDFLRKRQYEMPKLYRGGSLTPGKVESWTTNSKGAQTTHIGGSHRITVTHARDISEMLDEGYISIGGIGRMMGAPGESEVTMILL